MPKTLSKKAAQIAETAKKAGGMFVFATRDPSLIDAPDTSAVLAKFKYTEHSCEDCSHSFMAVAAKGLQYHCTSCGSGKIVAKTKTTAKLNIPADDKLTLVTCGSCNTHNILPGAVVASVSQLSCTACGHEMNYRSEATNSGKKAKAEKADADEMPMNHFDGISDTDDLDIEDMDSIDIDLDDDDEIEDVPEDDSGDELFDEEDTLNVADAGVPPVADTGVKGDNDPAPDASEEKRLNGVENLTQDGGVDIEVDLSDVVTERTGPDVQPVGEEVAPAIAFVYLGETMNVAVGNTIIASLTPETAGDNAELMFQRSFQVAVKNSIETLGLKAALKNYNFTTAKLKIKAGPQIAKLVKDAIAAEAKKVTASLDTVSEDFQQAMDIAVAGHAQNYWRNHTSPVKAALVNELTAAGLKSGSAERLVDRVFATHGVADLRTVLEIARDLASKPVEVRNGLAEAVNLTKYLPFQKAAVEDDVEDDDGEAGEEDEDDDNGVVATVATTVSNVDKSDTQVTANYKTPELQALLGGKSFSS